MIEPFGVRVLVCGPQTGSDLSNHTFTLGVFERFPRLLAHGLPEQKNPAAAKQTGFYWVMAAISAPAIC
jgi:hypothetical protein